MLKKDKMLDSDFIYEVTHPKWVATVILLNKAYTKWIIFVNYTKLNATCLNEPYTLPSID